MIHLFTDASFCDQTGIAVGGYQVRRGGLTLEQEVKILLGVKNSTEAEMQAIIAALNASVKHKNPTKTIRVFTDCHTLTDEVKIEAKWLLPLKVQKDLLKVHLGFKVHIHWVKSHKKKGNRQEWQNNEVDTLVRKKLRELRQDYNMKQARKRRNNIRKKKLPKYRDLPLSWGLQPIDCPVCRETHRLGLYYERRTLYYRGQVVKLRHFMYCCRKTHACFTTNESDERTMAPYYIFKNNKECQTQRKRPRTNLSRRS